MLAELPLQELRQARQMSQEKLAEILGGKQASVSKLEHRTDMYVSTLRSYIEAMGGELDIVARFQDGDVRIKQFQDLEIEPQVPHPPQASDPVGKEDEPACQT